MTHQHPATPTSQEIDKFFMLPLSEEERLTAAFCAGADQELEACRQWLEINGAPRKFIDGLLAARLPKPPNLKEQALKTLNFMESEAPYDKPMIDTIRRALELLPDDTTS